MPTKKTAKQQSKTILATKAVKKESIPKKALPKPKINSGQQVNKVQNHFKNENIIEKIQKVFDKSNVKNLGVGLHSVNIAPLDQADRTCLNYTTQFVPDGHGGGSFQLVCIQWSDD